MNILFIITKSNWGGAQRYVYDLAHSLATRSCKVVVALGGTGESNAEVGTLATKLASASIPYRHLVHFTRAVSLMREVRVVQELWKVMRAERPAVVHLNSSKAAGLGALVARLQGVKRIVFTIHGFPFTDMRPWYERALIHGATWITLLLVTDVICICTPDRLRAEKMWGIRNKLHFVPNGIEETVPLPSKRDARDRLLRIVPAFTSVARDMPWIMTGTELTPRKGIDAVIEACAILRFTEPHFRLIIVGSGEQESQLRAQVLRLELESHVIFAGFIPDLVSHLTAFDVFVLASHKEGLPYILLEVARARVPLIASAIDGIPDIIRDDSHGIGITPGKPDEIAKALVEVLRDPDASRARADALSRHIQTQFSLSRMTEETLAIYTRS